MPLPILDLGAIEPGDTRLIGRGYYEFVAKLRSASKGRANSADVWRARELTEARDYAIKVRTAPIHCDPEGAARDEHRAATDLRAAGVPNVVVPEIIILATDSDGNLLTISITQWIDGHDFLQPEIYASIGPTTESKCCIAVQLLRLLENAHQARKAHGDPNGGNFLLSVAGAIHLVDLESVVSDDNLTIRRLAGSRMRVRGRCLCPENYRAWHLDRFSNNDSEIPFDDLLGGDRFGIFSIIADVLTGTRAAGREDRLHRLQVLSKNRQLAKAATLLRHHLSLKTPLHELTVGSLRSALGALPGLSKATRAALLEGVAHPRDRQAMWTGIAAASAFGAAIALAVFGVGAPSTPLRVPAGTSVDAAASRRSVPLTTAVASATTSVDTGGAMSGTSGAGGQAATSGIGGGAFVPTSVAGPAVESVTSSSQPLNKGPSPELAAVLPLYPDSGPRRTPEQPRRTVKSPTCLIERNGVAVDAESALYRAACPAAHTIGTCSEPGATPLISIVGDDNEKRVFVHCPHETAPFNAPLPADSPVSASVVVAALQGLR